VAPLIVQSARAARAEAERLRRDSEALRLSVRRGVSNLHAATERASSAAARRPLQLASPWSTLEWVPEDNSLSRTLVPID
jgi:hypothetical protein